MRSQFLLLGVLVGMVVHAQVPSEGYFSNIEQVTAPQASGIFQFEEIPVSYYTGVPNVSIPIYTIQAGGYSLPIALNYHAGGHRINDAVDWTGLGWNLQAGGQIRSSPSGKYDHVSNGFYSNGGLMDDIENHSSLTSTEREDVANSALSGNFDFEPDLFHFSIPGQSGKYHIDDSDDYMQIPVTDLVFKDLSNGLGIYTPDGTLYEFDDGTSYSAVDLGDPGAKAGTAYLSKIISNGGAEISFTYGSVYYLTQYSDSERKSVLLNSATPQLTGTVSSTATFERSEVQVAKRRITRIDFPDGYMTFGTESTTTLFNDSRVSSHEKVSLYDLQGNLIRTWHLGVGKTDVNNSCERVKLLYVIEGSSNSTYKPAYVLEYNTNHLLPCAGAKTMDHWGFYNSNTASTLIPVKQFSAATITGANRNTDANKVKASMLKSITYPSGGKTEFTFEANTYSVNEYSKPNQSLTQTNVSTLTTTSLTIDYDQWVEVDVTSTSSNQDPAEATVQIIPSAGSTINLNQNLQDQYYYLTTGTYTVSTDPTSWTSTTLNLKYKSQGSLIKNRYAGGVRIQKIKTYDPLSTDPAMVRKFEYVDATETDRTSGVLLSETESYHYYTTRTYLNGSVSLTNYLILQSNSAAGSASNSVGYSRVKEIFGENGENGYNVYEYTVTPSVGGLLTTRPTDKSHLSGWLNAVSTYDKDNTILSSSSHTYSTTSYGTVVGLKVRERQSSYTDGAFVYEPPTLTSSTYSLLFDRVYRTKTVNKTYDPQTGQFLSNTVDYYRDDLPNYGTTSRSAQTTSDGDAVTEEVYFAHDFSSSPPSWISNMQTENCDLPILQLTKRDGLYVSGRFTQYKQLSSSADIAIDKIYVLETTTGLSTSPSTSILSNGSPTSDFELRATYDDYGGIGNPLEYHLEDDLHISLLWDDVDAAPIAKVENATNEDVAFTSFERNADGKFSFTAGQVQTGTGWLPSGERYYQLSSGNDVTLTSMNSSQTYIVSYWAKGGTITVNSQSGALYKSNSHSWNYYEMEVTGTTSFTFSGTASIDEIRIYPKGAYMTTYTYSPLIGVNSINDVRGESQYFEYDAFGRLLYVKDDDGNILSKNEYNYRP